MEIILDFDGTVVTHDFPKIGKDIGAQPVLKALVENGHKLILFTMRCNTILDLNKIDFFEPNDQEGHIETYLDDAVNWFKENDIPLYGVQTNPTQHTWTSSPKAYGQLIIDDAALGCPLTFLPSFHSRPFVNWRSITQMLNEMNLLNRDHHNDIMGAINKAFFMNLVSDGPDTTITEVIDRLNNK